MKIRVYYEFDVPESERELIINEKDLVGKTEDEKTEYIFDNIIMPYINDHMILSYDVIQN